MKYQPCPNNAHGPFYVVSDACMACEAPLVVAPDLMDFEGVSQSGDSHCRFRRQPRSEGEVRQAIDAIAACCSRAIRYAGTDKIILDRIAEPEVCDAWPIVHDDYCI